jgi:hypothetical protein
MLFETVYGPELERVHATVRMLAGAGSVDRAAIFEYLVPRGAAGVTKNVLDAISFLRSAGLLSGHDTLHAIDARPFRPVLLRQLRRIQTDPSAPPLDRLYLQIVEDLFVRPNRVFRRDVHSAINTTGALPLTKERLAAWARVLEYFGLGTRIEGGYQCAYTPDLLREIFEAHAIDRSEIESALRDIVDLYLPTRTAQGDASHAVWIPLAFLAEMGEIRLHSLQDSPARRYGAQAYTHMTVLRRSHATRRHKIPGDR